MSRGRKLKTSQNSRKLPLGSVHHDRLDPPVELAAEELAEYRRLIDVLESGGTLERVDLMCVANAARAKVLLDRACKAIGKRLEPAAVALMNGLMRQHRGLLRELGLTSQPSRTMFRPKPQGSERDDNPSKWSSKLKVS